MEVNFKKKFLVSLIALGIMVSSFLGISLWNKDVKIALADTQSDLSFSLINDNTAYKVTALNKSIVDVSIPAEYNGLPVTEIGDSAFSRCTSLENVFIPYTVTRIGTNAFTACSKLKNVSGMSSVQEIGNNAFANCTSLDKLILPGTLETLGSSILRNNPNEIYSRLPATTMATMNSSWNANLAATAEVTYGNHLVYVDHLDENQEKDGYEIKEYQNIYASEDVDKDFIVLSSYEGLPVYNIQAEAFAFCEFNSLTIKHESATFNHTLNISDQAFTWMIADSINIEVDISFYQDDDNPQNPSSGIFQDAEVRSIKLPVSLTTIPESMFLNCFALEEIVSTDSSLQANHLSNNITTIGKQAFEGCEALEELYIPSSITYIGNSAFHNLGSQKSQVIYMDLYQPGNNWDANWKGTLQADGDIQFNPIEITLHPENGEGTTIKTISYGKTQAISLDDIPEHEDANFTFDGYYTGADGAGVQCFDESMEITNLWALAQSSIHVYADWDGPNCHIDFEKEGGTGGTSFLDIEYGELLYTITIPSAAGKTFQGYYTEPEGQGTQYYDKNGVGLSEWEIVEDTTLHAYWYCIPYNIEYYLAENSQQIIFPEELTPATYTVEDEIEFLTFDYAGYRYVWNHSGIPEGSTGKVVVIGNRTLIEYTITYQMNGGTNNPENPTTYTVENAGVLKNPTHRERGFEGWTLNGSSITTLVGLTENITLVANWSSLTVKTLTSSMTSYTVTGEYSKIILPLTNFNSQCYIMVNSNVKQLYVEGSNSSIVYNLSIMKVHSSSLNLCFDNVSIKAQPSLCPIGTMGTLNLYTYGTVNIYGGDGLAGENGGVAILCNNLAIHCANDLYIEGGDGGDGVTGGNGGDAACAILLTGSYAIIHCPNVTIAAGLAGDPGSGGLITPDRWGAGSEAILSTNANSYLYVNPLYVNIVILSSSERTALNFVGGEYVNPPTVNPGIEIDIPLNPNPGIVPPILGGNPII